MARRSLKPQLNQIRAWVHQGRTDAWIAHQLEISATELREFRKQYDLSPDDENAGSSEIDLRDEIEAQFEAFAASGLKLDHVNAHKHFHLHPTIGRFVVEIGRKYGMQSVRAPCEPLAVLRAVEPNAAGGDIERFCGNRLKDRLWAAGIWSPDHVFGLSWSGAMNTRRVAGILEHLPDGVSEIYLHPAISSYSGSTAGYRYADELCALTAAQTIDAARALSLGSFRDFAKA